MTNSKKKSFIRFGNIPLDEISSIYDGDNGVVGKESGTSCYEFIKQNGNFKIILSSLSLGFLYDLIGFLDQLEENKTPAFLIEAIQVGIGNYGEPVVKDIKIIRKIQRIELTVPHPKSKMDRINPQLI